MSIAGERAEDSLEPALGRASVVVLGSPAELVRLQTGVQFAQDAGAVTARVVSVAPEDLAAPGGATGLASLFGGATSSTERLVTGLALGPENVRALAVLALAAETETTTVILGPGALLLRWPSGLLDVAQRHGAAIPAIRLPADIDVFEPWFGSAVGSVCDWNVLAVQRGGTELLAAVHRRAVEALREFDFDYARRALSNITVVAPEYVLPDGCVIDPAFLGDGDDIPTNLEAVLLAGFDPQRPWVPDSRMRRPRVTSVKRPRLHKLLNDSRFASWPSVETQTAAQVDDLGLQRICGAIVAQGRLAELPSAMCTEAELRDWLASLTGGESFKAVTNAMMVVWQTRPDLQAIFPRPLGPDATRFYDWASGSGVDEGAVPEWCLPPRPKQRNASTTERVLRRVGRVAKNPSSSSQTSVSNGVLVVGHLDTRNGLGNVGRRFLQDLHAFGVPTSHRIWNTGSHSRVDFRSDPGPPREWAVSILGAEDGVLSRVPPAFTEAAVRAGVVFWEVEGEVPGSYEYPMLYDRLWAPTSFLREILERQTDLPVSVMPQRGFDDELFDRSLARPITTGDRPYALFVFDFFSTSARKNPVGAVKAFTRAFNPTDGPRLLLKTLNANGARSDHAELVSAIEGHPHIELITEDLEEEALFQLISGSTAYISLHRSEGFGLTMAEAMALGVPVIATGYGGNTDFLTEDTGWVVPWEYTQVGRYGYPYPERARWAEPDIDAAADALRDVFSGGPDVERRAAAGRQKIRDLYGLQALREFFEREGLPMAEGSDPQD